MKNFLVWVLLCAFIPAACSDITGAAFDAAEEAAGSSGNAGQPGIVKRGDGSDLEEFNVIYKDGDPYRLTLKVDDEWESIEWYINNPKKPASKTSTLDIDARGLSEAEYHVMFTGSLGGLLYSETVNVAVKSTLTEDITWMDTGKNSSQTEFDLNAWEGMGESIEKWKLLAAETPRVYFAVKKRPFQAITVVGEHSDKVKMADIGEVVDGLKTTANLVVFTVDTGDVETLFSGGERHFTMMVSDENKGSEGNKMVQVTLELRPYLTGAAIFAVKDGALERITAKNVEAYANSLYKTHLNTGFPSWGIKIDDVTGLAGAFEWLDSYAAGGTDADNLKEYLVRVEKNETLKRTALTGSIPKNSSINVKNIKIRLRGYGSERRIKHDPTQPTSNDATYWKGNNEDGSYIKNYSFISIGVFQELQQAKNNTCNITLQLEDNITIDGEGLAAGSSSPGWFNVVYAGNGCAFVMKAGSKLTGANGIHPVYIDFDTGKFEMDGGEISNCKNNAYAVYLADFNSKRSQNMFIYRGGTFFNNDSNIIYVGGDSKPMRFCNDSLFQPN
ncbi:MAG: hypothetical protein LBK66_09225 [Spirochaetaceae bacterium]|jgi:hypothetical protein|nr:hypothetical protein [Spirochaetaceae bacterium]